MHSADRVQFKGSYRRYKPNLIWKAHIENKCKSFAWTLIQSKILTADVLTSRVRPHQDCYVGRNGPLQTGLHLRLHCPFAKLVWHQVLVWEHFDTGLIQHVDDSSSISSWWEAMTQKVEKVQQRRFNGFAIYIMWNL